ncbi:MAG: hypothetical protein P9E24_08550 [Candidatus Competibacter sp.]|nr:hypothetical protein [Candidatus Competibacter sp.]MDG4582943.1 hypothetical protein [Candidatus Competibacter sp.]
MIRLLAKCFRLMLGPQLFLKNGQTLAIRWRKAILLTEVEVIPQPLVIVRTLPGHQVLLHQPRLVALDEFRGDGEHGGISGVAEHTLSDMLPKKISKIK